MTEISSPSLSMLSMRSSAVAILTFSPEYIRAKAASLSTYRLRLFFIRGGSTCVWKSIIIVKPRNRADFRLAPLFFFLGCPFLRRGFSRWFFRLSFSLRLGPLFTLSHHRFLDDRLLFLNLNYDFGDFHHQHLGVVNTGDIRVEDNVLDMKGLFQFKQHAYVNFYLRRYFFRQTLNEIGRASCRERV